jgi:hypothetical protein
MSEERWTNNRRSDGCEIMMGIDGWVIMPGCEGLPITPCPFCGQRFAGDFDGLRAAKQLADIMYPIEKPEPATNVSASIY